MYKYSHLNVPKSVGCISGLHSPFEYSTFPRLVIVMQYPLIYMYVCIWTCNIWPWLSNMHKSLFLYLSIGVGSRRQGGRYPSYTVIPYKYGFFMQMYPDNLWLGLRKPVLSTHKFWPHFQSLKFNPFSSEYDFI